MHTYDDSRRQASGKIVNTFRAHGPNLLDRLIIWEIKSVQVNSRQPSMSSVDCHKVDYFSDAVDLIQCFLPLLSVKSLSMRLSPRLNMYVCIGHYLILRRVIRFGHLLHINLVSRVVTCLGIRLSWLPRWILTITYFPFLPLYSILKYRGYVWRLLLFFGVRIQMPLKHAPRPSLENDHLVCLLFERLSLESSTRLSLESSSRLRFHDRSPALRQVSTTPISFTISLIIPILWLGPP